jgi:hypothetical protein
MKPEESASPFRRSILLASVAAVALLAASSPGHAQGTAGGTPAPSRDPAALARLDAMGAYLRSLKTFEVKADASKDEVLVDGQKLQFNSTLSYQVSAPDKLRAAFRSDRKHRDFYYDGKTLTQVAPRAGYYASVALSGTVGELMKAAAQRYDIEMPLADLFLWGTPASDNGDITSAIRIGPARINGVDCEHFALRQPGVDWQIWVERGARALPHKMVITTADEPSQPQYAATLKWNLAASPAASSFTFVPPKGLHRIELKPVVAGN